MDMHHLGYLQFVTLADVEHLQEKEKTYRGSWKRRGGVGAFMMLARKWDRLEGMLDSSAWNWDVFKAIGAQTEYETNNKKEIGTDGTVLAEIRDLRRYLLLVEAEMMAQTAPRPKPTVAELEAILNAPEPEVAVRRDGSTEPVDLYAELAAIWSLPYTEARARVRRLAFKNPATERSAEEALKELGYNWKQTREEVIETLRKVSWNTENDRVARAEDVPVVDSNKHATAARPMDGMPRSYYEDPESGCCLPVIDPSDCNFWLIDRRNAPRESWDHLPRLSTEQNHKEWSELPREYAALYEWNGEKYVMREEFREWWGKE